MELPSGVEPLVLKDGTVINPVDGNPVTNSDALLIEVPNTSAMQREIVASRKRLSDLPLPPQQMNTVSVILCYSLLGISDADIGLQLGLSEEQIGRIKISDVFADVQTRCIDAITESDKDAVRNMLVANSRLAANRVAELLDHRNADMRLAAAKDVLDRAGHRPADIIEHRHKIEGGLKIEYVKREDRQIPTIDMTTEGEF